MKFNSVDNPNVYYEFGGQFKELYLRDSYNKIVCANLLRSNVARHEMYILKKIKFLTSIKAQDMRMWLSYKPKIDHNTFLWPVDFVLIPEGISLQDLKSFLPLSSNNNYSDDIDETLSADASVGLVFPYWHEERVENLSDIVVKLQRGGRLNYENPDVLNIVIGILSAIKELNDNGYIFNEFHASKFHPSRFYVKENGKIIVDFSTLMTAENLHTDLNKCDISNEDNFDYKNVYPLEFADPIITMYNIAKTKKPIELQNFNKVESFTGLDQESQNYSLAAFLFFLMYGQLPYWGHVFAGMKDDDIHEHYRTFRELYLSTPAFIFDKGDHIDNDIADYGYGEKVTELWNKTPEGIRKMFTKVLGWDNALRLVKPKNPSASDWLEALKDSGVLQMIC